MGREKEEGEEEERGKKRRGEERAAYPIVHEAVIVQ